MKNIILTFTFCVTACFTLVAQADKKEIEKSIDALNKAMLNQDKSGLDNLTAYDLTYGHSTGLIENRLEFENAVVGGNVKFTSIENTEQNIQITGTVATVRSKTAIKGVANNKPLDLKIGILMVWIRENGSWKLLARQGYKL